MTLRLIVKGSRFAAAQAASHRRVPFVFCRETEHGETCGITSSRFWPDVASWFNEDVTRKAPYPVGSLLHYSDMPDPD
jgi:hypothetical protein